MLGHLLKNFTHHSKNQSIFLDNQKSEKIELSELRYRRLFETAQDGILILDAFSGKITDANPFLKELLGYSDLELVGKQLWQIGVFKDIVDSKKAFLDLQNTGYIRYKDLPLQTKEGQSIDVEFISNSYIVGSQKVIQCNIRDITNRKKAEEVAETRTKQLEDLTRSQELTKKAMLNVMEDLEQAKTTIEIEKAKDEAMLDSIGEGLIAVNNEHKVIVINKAAENILGLKMKDVMGKQMKNFPLQDEAGNPMLLDKIPTNIVRNIYFFVRKDKTRFPISINVTSIKLAGKNIGVINIFRDITREKEIDRAKSEFVSLASHQLRTPLGISKWYLEALQEEGFISNVSEKAKDYLAEVYKSNERLLAVVRGLLSVSRIDQGTVRNTPKSINITELVQTVIKELSIAANKNKISINLELKDKTLALFIDPLRLQQIVENLIANAIEYSNPGGKVAVIVAKEAGQVVISIQDRGIGISKEDQKHLFTKFFRSAKATIKNTEGTGLGLYIVKSYLQEWGGEVKVKSAEGQGSTFTISLPLRNPIVKKKG